jgi:hypothetical protein
MSQYLFDTLVEYFDMHKRAQRIVRGAPQLLLGILWGARDRYAAETDASGVREVVELRSGGAKMRGYGNRRGITVLALLLLIIALLVGGFFLVRYLRLTS